MKYSSVRSISLQPLKKMWNSKYPLQDLLTPLLSLFLILATGLLAKAQSDNLDSYSSAAQLMAAGWFELDLNPALVSTTFPPVGNGLGLRIQANPFPGTAPAVGGWYRTNDYSDFYFALDLAN